MATRQNTPLNSLQYFPCRVMVLDKGEVAEIGDVEQLKNKKDGLFRVMMLDAGLLEIEQNKKNWRTRTPIFTEMN